MNRNPLIEMEIAEPIYEFTGDYHFLSNFAAAEFVWDNIVWPNSEAAYQAAKVLDRHTRLWFARLDSPAAAKKAGKNVDLRADWELVKYQIMYEIVKAKFSQNPQLRAKLLETGRRHLEEGNTWKDRVWGVCPPRSGNGNNALGKILMQVREELAS